MLWSLFWSQGAFTRENNPSKWSFNNNCVYNGSHLMLLDPSLFLSSVFYLETQWKSRSRSRWPSSQFLQVPIFMSCCVQHIYIESSLTDQYYFRICVFIFQTLLYSSGLCLVACQLGKSYWSTCFYQLAPYFIWFFHLYNITGIKV